MQAFDRAAAAATFRELASAWASIRPEPAPSMSVADWEAALRSMHAQMNKLVAAGQWFSGPADMMRLLNVAHEELKHSRMVAWLLTPTGRHGLGDDLLRRILVAGWGEAPAETATAIVRREVTRGGTRADVVVCIEGMTLVVENKVWSPEGAGQCQAVFDEWTGTAEQVRFLFLTQEGKPPTSTRTAETAAVWRSLSYGGFASFLEASLAAQLLNRGDGEAAAREYLKTLRSTIGRRPTAEITVGGGNVAV